MHDTPVDLFDETRTALANLRPAKLTDIATRLGYPPSAAGMLSDVLHGRHDHISDARLNDLRRRLGLSHNVTIPARPCPTCNVVHGDGYDCHGIPGEVAIVPAGARVIPPAKRKRPPYRRPTWAMVRALEARIAELESRT